MPIVIFTTYICSNRSQKNHRHDCKTPHCDCTCKHLLQTALQVFLEPLRKVSSMTAVEDLHRQCQGNEGERRRLQALGMGLGIKAWNDDFFAMLKEAENSQVEPKPKPPTSAHTTVKVINKLPCTSQICVLITTQISDQRKMSCHMWDSRPQPLCSLDRVL